ncbi:MAG: dienelactone hydrolase family protein [Pseudomonadota bacterium]
MCDEETEQDALAFKNTFQKTMSRRQFNTLTTGAAAAMLIPGATASQDTASVQIVEDDVMVTTPDGTSDCFFVHPSEGRHPGVILWPDIYGLRPSYRTMAKRLAKSGYAALVVNPYYRDARVPVLAEGASLRDPEVRGKIFPMRQKLTPAAQRSDGRAYVRYLDASDAVDTDRLIGTMGYCMTGSFAMRTAAAEPKRIGAVASFHGGGLVTYDDDSPHRSIKESKAAALIVIAENDHEKEPGSQEALRKAYQRAGLNAEVEVYKGAMHGFCSLDSQAYHEIQAEKAWARLLHMFHRHLI